MERDIRDQDRERHVRSSEVASGRDYAHLVMDRKDVYHWCVQAAEHRDHRRTLCGLAIDGRWLVQGGPLGPFSGAFVGYPTMAELCVECMERMSRAAREVAEQLGRVDPA